MTAYDISQKKYWNEYQKQYYKENKDQILVIRKEYYEENKERLCEKNNCECGCKYSIVHKSRHLKSNKHTYWIACQHYKKQLFARFLTSIKA